MIHRRELEPAWRRVRWFLVAAFGQRTCAPSDGTAWGLGAPRHVRSALGEPARGGLHLRARRKLSQAQRRGGWRQAQTIMTLPTRARVGVHHQIRPRAERP
jgi:hypothetical protein